MKFFNKLKKITDHLFTKHLFVTNTSLGIFFIGAGDAIQQTIEKKMYSKKYEMGRTGNMMISGSVFGVLGHFWYKFLDSKFPGQAAKTVGKKLLAEMVIGPPLFLGFFIGVGYLQSKPVQESFEEFKKNILLICAADWGIYAPLQAVNFFYVAPRYRLLYVCVLCLGYDIFLSYVIHKEDLKKLPEDRKDKVISSH